MNPFYDTTNLDLAEPWYDGWKTSSTKEAALEALESASTHWLAIFQGDNIVAKIPKTGDDVWKVVYTDSTYADSSSTATRIAQGQPYLKVPLAGVTIFDNVDDNVKKTRFLNAFTGMLFTYGSTYSNHYDNKLIVTDSGTQPKIALYSDEPTVVDFT